MKFHQTILHSDSCVHSIQEQYMAESYEVDGGRNSNSVGSKTLPFGQCSCFRCSETPERHLQYNLGTRTCPRLHILLLHSNIQDLLSPIIGLIYSKIL